jgi:hypothetical protein
VSRLNSRVTWAGLASAALAVALVFLNTMLAGSPHVWTGNLMVTAYVLAAAATALGLCGGLGLRFPVLGERPARPSFPILPEPPPDDDPRSVLREALDAASSSRDTRGALAANEVRRQLHSHCAACGYPFDRPRSSRPATAAAPAVSASRRPWPRRLRINGRTSPIRVHPQAADHPEAG